MWPCGPVSMSHSLPNIQRGTHTFATGHVTTSITCCANRQDPRVLCHSPSRLRGSLRDRLSCSQPDVLTSSYTALPALDRVAENNFRNRVHATSSHFGGHMQFCSEGIFIKRSMQFSPYGPDTPTNATPHHRVGW